MIYAFLAVLLEATSKGDQPQYFLVTDGFTRLNSDKQADSSWGRSKENHMFICVYSLSEIEANTDEVGEAISGDAASVN